MREYSVIERNGLIIFENKKTKAEGGIFETQISAVKGLLELTFKNVISAQHGTEIFDQILQTSIPFQKITEKNAHKILAERKSALVEVKIIGLLIQQAVISQSHDGPHLWICKNCNDHGAIFIPNGRTGPVESKQEALEYLEILHDEKHISLGEKISLEQDIKESSLPEKKIDPTMN